MRLHETCKKYRQLSYQLVSKIKDYIILVYRLTKALKGNKIRKEVFMDAADGVETTIMNDRMKDR